jgi:ubiquinone/menaquinone biosynthesis C-methylase UbiE
MKVLFLHGWTSKPGGVKPTFLVTHGHEVLNPALPDDDFDAALRIAQTEFDRHHPDVVVGSSRGGAVAMNLDAGSTPLVLLCPAWKRWGKATGVKPGTVILHSPADDVIPFADTRELLDKSGLSGPVIVGNDHRLADADSLQAMLQACERATGNAPPPRSSSTYVLRGGEQAADRLRLLTHVMWPTTRALLHRFKVRPGMSCLDAGCGIGAVTLELKRLVAPDGRALGIDLDEGCLTVARHEAGRLGLAAEFRTVSVTDLQESSAHDLVYARFLLSHLADPAHALAKLVAAARPGSLVAVEDVEFAGHFSFPACPAFDRYVSLYQQAVRGRGADPNIGPRLPELLLDGGLQQVRTKVVQPVFRTGQGKRLAQVTMAHIRESVIAAGLATHAQVDAIVAGLDKFARSPRTLISLPRIFQVWGRRAP